MECTVNQELLLTVRDEIEDFRSVLNIEKVKIVFQPEDLK